MENLDKAYEYMERALEVLENMPNASFDLKRDIDIFDITMISSIKCDVEEMMEEL